MNEAWTLAPSWLAGGLLGALFFGGLWWTVKMGVSSKRPALWFFVSLPLRASVTLVGFYLVAGRHGDRMLSCLLGFVMASVVVTRLLRLPPSEGRPRPLGPQTGPRASHAP